uniref:Pseudouridine synthase RsuA/RluA-like domain-containing protein n=1 Tax=Ditylum brightwellii TaxID=49249 RepID=A0A7S4QDK0_9STRA
MGLKTRWKLSSNGASYEQIPVNPIPVAVPTRLDELLVAMALFPSIRRARIAIKGGRVQIIGTLGGVVHNQSRRQGEGVVSMSDETNSRGDILKEVCTDHGILVDPSKVTITLDGEMKPIHHLLCSYILLHKPRGYICSSTPEKGAPGVFDLFRDKSNDDDQVGQISSINQTCLFVCGRLDCQSEGLLLVTNDGKLGRKLLHPGRCEKQYEVLITCKKEGGSSMDCRILHSIFATVCRDGQYIIEGSKEVMVRPVSMCIIKQPTRISQLDIPDEEVEPNVITTWIQVVLTDGRKRELRRLFGALGYRVLQLVRTEFCSISDNELLQRPGDFRHLSLDEIAKLQSIT